MMNWLDMMRPFGGTDKTRRLRQRRRFSRRVQALSVASALGSAGCICALGGLLAPGIAAASSRQARPHHVVTVTLGEDTVSALEWPIYIGLKHGTFKRAGINLKVVTVQSDPDEVLGILSGSLDIASGSPQALMTSVSQGHHTPEIVGTDMMQPVYTLVGAKSVTSLAGLAGKAVGVSSSESIDAIWMKELLAKHHVQNVQFEDIGGSASRATALESGAIAATFLTQPQDIAALASGYRRLGSSTEINPSIVWETFDVTRSWAKGHAKVLREYLQALQGVLNWMYTPRHKAAAIRLLEQETATTHAAAAATYKLEVTQHHLPATVKPTAVAVRTMIADLSKLHLLNQPVTVKEVLNTSYVPKTVDLQKKHSKQ